MSLRNPARVRRARTLSRFVGAVVGMVLGVMYGLFILSNSTGVLTDNRSVALAAVLAAGVAGAAALALAGPLLSVEPFLWLERTLEEAPAAQVVGATAGLLVALLVSALVAVLLAPLPWGLGVLVSLCVACVLVYVGVRAGSRRREVLTEVFARRGAAHETADHLAPLDGQPVLLDTSVLIDGRIVDVAAAGFMPGRLLIPSFVLEELQRVADSGDPVRRAKGRRGLDIVDELRNGSDVVCEVIDIEFPGRTEVDSQLVKLARLRSAALMTQDYNLTRLAQVEGVRVLNLNTLANAVKPIVASGETMTIAVVKEGKEPHQGVGYLEDGTMVVVENGRHHLDETLLVTVTSVLQTAAGRMIFAVYDEPDAPRAARASRQPRAARVAQR
ncbi:MAG: hypothetical protein JOZ46_08100 [Candidatus Dormibacteraeota bacterium]|nr:hypothetical protein [Candidatus Dormibacteraeota bacterium]MBV9525760.1 hypothetical protein [Candidatus Dormibacteraeota bacterium]